MINKRKKLNWEITRNIYVNRLCSIKEIMKKVASIRIGEHNRSQVGEEINK
jgi:hypothetical protein